MDKKKKAIVFTAFLLILLTLATLFSPVFVNSADACGRHKPYKPRPPPLGKYIKKYFVYPDETSIGAGLSVSLYDSSGTVLIQGPHTTDASGCVIFGSGVPDGTYVIKWSWQGVACSETVTINCTKIIWTFVNVVPYWTVEKTFVYDLPGAGYPPVVGLNVTFDGRWALTDASGTATFNNVKAGNYTLEWTWGGVKKTEKVSIGFQDPTPVEMTNYLEPKSGEKFWGGKLHLVEELR